MFPGSTELELEAGIVSSGRIFRSGKRRKTEKGWWNPSMFEESEHELWSYEDEGSCDEEDDYSPISEGPKAEDSAETSRLGRNYITPTISQEVRYRVSSPENTANTDSAIPVTSVWEGTPPMNSKLENPNSNSMVATDVRLPTFNGNGTEDPEQH